MRELIKNPFKRLQKSAVVKLFFGVTYISNAQLTQKVSWDYPTKPGTEEWNLLKTEQESFAAVQVPEEVLEKMSSEEIVHLCVNFPRFGYFGAFVTPQQDGFSVMIDKYNIFERLFSKKGVGKSLIVAYKDAGMKGFKTLPYANEFWTIKLHYLELLLTQNAILQSMSPEERFELLVESRKKFSEKIYDEAFSSLSGLLCSVRIMATLLDIEEYQELKLSSKRQITSQFIQTGMLVDVSTIDEIIGIADNYIKTKEQNP